MAKENQKENFPMRENRVEQMELELLKKYKSTAMEGKR